MFIHSIQLQIALASIDLLSAEVGSRFVYSTCSLNPLEDEAVVCDILRKHSDTLRLVDLGLSMEAYLPSDAAGGAAAVVGGAGRPLSDKLQHLRRFKWRNGLSWWRTDVDVMVNEEDHDVLDSEGEAYGEDETAPRQPAGTKRKRGDRDINSGSQSSAQRQTDKQMLLEKQRSIAKLPSLLPSMLPPSAEDEANVKFNLDRSMRVLPHDQDTGGFFIAVFERYASPRSTSAAPATASVSESTAKSTSSMTKKEKAVAKDGINEGLDESGVTHEKELSILKNICGFNPKQISLSATEKETLTAAETDSALLLQWRKAVSAYNYECVSPQLLSGIVHASCPGAPTDDCGKNSGHLVSLICFECCLQMFQFFLPFCPLLLLLLLTSCSYCAPTLMISPRVSSHKRRWLLLPRRRRRRRSRSKPLLVRPGKD